jgi:hypothetical protein
MYCHLAGGKLLDAIGLSDEQLTRAERVSGIERNLGPVARQVAGHRWA